VKYSPLYIDPFTDSKIGKALLIDLSEESLRMFEVLFSHITAPAFVIIFFCIAVVLTWLSNEAPVFLLGRLLRFFIISYLCFPFIMLMLEIGCGVGDTLVTKDNYLLNDFSGSLESFTALGKNFFNESSSWVDFVNPSKYVGKASYFFLTQIVIRFAMFAVGASFSIILFFGLVASLISCTLSILPTHSKNWKYPLSVGLWGLVTPIAIVILTQLCSSIFVVPSMKGDNVGLAQLLFLLLFVFYLFGAFKLSQSIVNGDGIAESAAAMGMSAMTGYATGVMVKAATLGKSGLLKAGSFLKMQDGKISNLANTSRLQNPRNLHDVARKKFGRNGGGIREGIARSYDNARHPIDTLKRMSEEKNIAKSQLDAIGASSKLGRNVDSSALSSIDNVSLTPLQRERMAPDVHTPLFDRAMSNGHINASDTYYHDISKWDSYSPEKKISLAEKFNVGDNSKNGHVYYPKDWNVDSTDFESHKSTMESISFNSDFIDPEITEREEQYSNKSIRNPKSQNYKPEQKRRPKYSGSGTSSRQRGNNVRL